MATFTGFDPYKLTGIRVKDRELGHGSYATVIELEYLGLKCAGKKIHDVLLRQGDASYTVRRFEEECRLLSQIRHPNIVQFLGVYFQQGVRAPILVMEFLPTNLTSCIEEYGILPKSTSYSILHDVAIGLHYLHSQRPPIIHRDLSSNNVLLTPSMTAKISDLGVARILRLTPLQVSRMTQTPGTPAYMPPEVMVAKPNYDTSVDEFSYGIMMIHIFSGQWPEPQVGQTRFVDDTLVPVTEAERREMFLQAIGADHPLMDLVLKCISNNPRGRAHTSELVERIAEMKSQFPSTFANHLEMLRRIETNKEQFATNREGMTNEQQSLQASLMWKSCANLPEALCNGVAAVIDGCVYCYFAAYNAYLIYCYDPAQDIWTILPPLPVKWIGLGHINEKLVSVGGFTRDKRTVNELYTYDKVSCMWEQTFPPMPTARRSPSILQIQSAFLAVGGVEEGDMFTNTVEILKLDVMQWYRCKAAQIPIGCCYISLVAIGKICYIIGGSYGFHENTTFLNQALYASIDDLLDSTVAASESSSHSGTIWKSLPSTPRYVPTATVLAGRLLAIGGGNQPKGGADMKEVYMYSDTAKCWMYVSDLPAPRSDTIVVALSATEILVIGGYNDEDVNTVYKGTLTTGSCLFENY